MLIVFVPGQPFQLSLIIVSRFPVKQQVRPQTFIVNQ